MEQVIEVLAKRLGTEISALLRCDLPTETKLLEYNSKIYPALKCEVIYTKFQFGENHSLAMTIERPIK